jgi:proteasome lid subunit RPN8/RPN11
VTPLPDSRLEDVSIEELRERLRRSTDGDEVKRLVVARETLAGKTPAEIEERFGWSKEVVESWIGLIERDGLDAGTSPPDPPATRDSRSPLWLGVAIVVAAVLVAVAVQGGVFSPSALLEVQPGGALGGGAGSGVAGTPVDGAIEIDTMDVQYLNRIFREQDTELAYCGVFDDRQLRPRLANLTVSTRDHARFTAEECRRQAAGGIAMVHTHPNGNPEVSPGDRDAFRDSEYVYTCIQHGQVTMEAGAEADKLRCYERADGSDELRRVPVRVTAPSG